MSHFNLANTPIKCYALLWLLGMTDLACSEASGANRNTDQLSALRQIHQLLLILGLSQIRQIAIVAHLQNTQQRLRVFHHLRKLVWPSVACQICMIEGNTVCC